MEYKKRALVISRLTWSSLLFFLFFRLIKSDTIYYYEMSEYFSKRLQIINFIERFNVKWIKKEYVDCSEYERGFFFAKEFADVIFKKVDNAHSINEISKHFSIPESLQKKIEVVWKKNISDFILLFSHQYAAAVYLINKKRYKKVTLIAFNSMASFLQDQFKSNMKVVVFPALSFLGTTFEILKKKVSVKHLKNFVGRERKPNKTQNNLQKYNAKKIDVEKFKVAFFPHQGIFYAKSFVKDHFYNNNSESPLFKSNILHISLNEKKKGHMPHIVNSLKYYDESKIPYIDSSDLNCSKKRHLIDYCKLLIKMKGKVLNDLYRYGIDFLIMASLAFYKINEYRFIVSRLKSLRVALAGYDILFPCELSIALALSGVKVCANQERLIQAFYPHTYLIFDYYFVAGEGVVERGLKNCHIENCLPVGLVRVDKLFEYEKKNIFDEKYDLIKKTKKLVLVLDYHLPPNDFEDIQSRGGVATVKNMRRFYNDLVNLALEFPSLHIVIKGKMVESYKSSYISDIVERIKQIENIDIELDLEKYDAYYIAEKADLTIACHTSLADELLAAGRKVIFYEISDYMAIYFDYDNLPIIVKDYKALKCHVQNFLNGIYLNADTINKLKEFYSNCYHGKVRETIQSSLEQLIKS